MSWWGRWDPRNIVTMLSMALGGLIFHGVFHARMIEHYHTLWDKVAYFAVLLGTCVAVSVVPAVVGFVLAKKGWVSNNEQAMRTGLRETRTEHALVLLVSICFLGFVWTRLPKPDSEILRDLRSAPTKVTPRDFVALANRGVVDALPYLIEFMEQQNSEMRWYALDVVCVLAKQPAFKVSFRTDPAAKESALRACIKWWRESTNSSEEAK